MIPAIHKARWGAFLQSLNSEERSKIIDQALQAMFRQGFENPGQNTDQQQWAAMLWQMATMDEAGWHHLDPPKIVLPDSDPALFRF